MRKERMNDRGFSLVELIIVIAIMAILIVVLAPQYLRYVERSRNSTDLQNATTIVDAIQIYAADPQANPPITNADTGAIITVNENGTPSTCPNAQMQAALTNAGVNIANIQCSSRTAWTGYTITVTVGTDGNVEFAYEGIGEATAGTFESMMTGGTTS